MSDYTHRQAEATTLCQDFVKWSQSQPAPPEGDADAAREREQIPRKVAEYFEARKRCLEELVPVVKAVCRAAWDLPGYADEASWHERVDSLRAVARQSLGNMLEGV